MGKKCCICGEEAKLKIKNSSDYYCEECAIDSFGDISVLVSVEEDAKKLKAVVDEKAKQGNDEDADETQETIDDTEVQED